jgi:hypothetical protein
MKSVCFNLERNEVFLVYSIDEYDRMPIDSTLYLKCYNKINASDWRNIQNQLSYYKRTEMIVHYNSICNTKF